MKTICDSCEALGEQIRKVVPTEALEALIIATARLAGDLVANRDNVQQAITTTCVARAMRICVLASPPEGRHLTYAVFRKHGFDLEDMSYRENGAIH